MSPTKSFIPYALTVINFSYQIFPVLAILSSSRWLHSPRVELVQTVGTRFRVCVELAATLSIYSSISSLPTIRTLLPPFYFPLQSPDHISCARCTVLTCASARPSASATTARTCKLFINKSHSADRLHSIYSREVS